MSATLQSSEVRILATTSKASRGLLKAVHVAEGDIVERDAPLVTLEAMKMENELRAPSRARVTTLHARAGAKVEGGAVLAVLAELEA